MGTARIALPLATTYSTSHLSVARGLIGFL